MFDGVPDQFHRFIAAASTRTTSLSQLPLSFPSATLHHLHHVSSPAAVAGPTFQPPFDPPITFNHHQIPPLPPQPAQYSFFHSLHLPSSLQPKTSTTAGALKQDDNNSRNQKNNAGGGGSGGLVVGLDLEIDGGITSSSNIPTDHHHHHHHHQLQHHPVDDHDIQPWSTDEVLALLRIRSSMENWFPEFSWEHVSRKLAELGFKRSAEKCKEKFEEESNYFNTINSQNNYTKIINSTTTTNNNNNGSSYRVFSDDLEELYTDHHDDRVDGDDNDDDNRGSDHHQHRVVNVDEKNKTVEEEKPSDEEEDKNNLAGHDKDHQDDQTMEINPSDNHGSDDDIRSKKRKREEEMKKKKMSKKEKFEMFKGFCEEIVKKMMIQQEEMHKKLLEDMVKRDEEKVAREEIWKKKETERINKELDMRAQEQAISGDRQSAIINFLKNFTAAGIFEETTTQDLAKVLSKNLSSSSSSSLLNNNLPQNPNDPPPPDHDPSSDHHHYLVNYSQNNDDQTLLPKSPTISITRPSEDNHEANPVLPDQNHTLKTPTLPPLALTPQDPNSLNSQNSTLPAPMQKPPQNPKSAINEKEDMGKRWPRDEVLALINLRCSLYNNSNHDQDHKEGSSASASSSGSGKAPLWERISQGMLELGYKRSAKRCKEKWENINKYFRKTREINKKRSIDSRTCPYFHQLNTLYNQGTLVAPPPSGVGSENLPILPEKNSDSPETLRPGNYSNHIDSIVHVRPDHQGEKSVVQIPSYDFDF